MAVPTSPVEICRLALDRIGESEATPISSIELPETRNELICARNYDLSRQCLLREHVWNFSRAEATLARVGDGGIDYQDRFLMPDDCLKIIQIGSRLNRIADYNIKGREIFINSALNPLTTSNSLELRYVKDVTDVKLFDPSFIECLALSLALKLSAGVVERETQIASLTKQLATQMPDALAVNAQERVPVKVSYSRWARARQSHFEEVSRNRVYWIGVWD